MTVGSGPPLLVAVAPSFVVAVAPLSPPCAAGVMPALSDATVVAEVTTVLEIVELE